MRKKSGLTRKYFQLIREKNLDPLGHEDTRARDPRDLVHSIVVFVIEKFPEYILF